MSPRILSPGVCAIATALALPAWAQTGTTGTGTTTLLPDTVVSASRVPVDREKVGSAHSVVTGQELQNDGSPILSNKLRDLPSMNVNRSGGVGGLTNIRIRGSEANHALVIIDGIKVNDPGAGDVFDFAHLLSFGVSRVEVLRGPQSGIYGADALAGVVSIETPAGRKGLRIQSISEGGSFSTYTNGGRVSGGWDWLRFSFTGIRFQTKGTNASRSSVAGFSGEEDEYSNTTLHAKINAAVAPWLDLTFVGRYVNSRLQFDADSNFDGILNDADRVQKIESYAWLARARFKKLGGDWITTFTFSGLHSDTENLANGLFNSYFVGGRLKFAGQTSYKFRTPSIAKAEHQVIFAVEYERETFEQLFIFNPATTGQEQSRTQTGFVGEYRVALWNQVFLSGALRYDINEDFENALTWRGTAAWLLRKWGTRFHASLGRGVKNPTFVEQFGFFPGTFVGNPNLRPESSIAFDVGIEQKFFQGRLVFDLTYFQALLEDEINGSVPLGGGLTTARNVDGLSRRRGFEFTFAARIAEGLVVKGHYSYLISQQIHQEELRRPRHSGAVSVNYRFWEKKANINLAVRFNGPSKDIGPTFPHRTTVGGFVLVSLAASYRVHKYFEVFGRIENVTNRRYEEIFGFQGPRIGAFVGVRVNLDLFQ